jgi:hypothetical protein
MNQKAVRSGDWKLIIDGAVTRTFLFSLKDDSGERHDWFARRPDVAKRLLYSGCSPNGTRCRHGGESFRGDTAVIDSPL